MWKEGYISVCQRVWEMGRSIPAKMFLSAFIDSVSLSTQAKGIHLVPLIFLTKEESGDKYLFHIMDFLFAASSLVFLK